MPCVGSTPVSDSGHFLYSPEFTVVHFKGAYLPKCLFSRARRHHHPEYQVTLKRSQEHSSTIIEHN